jgi:hypothetical protein
VVLIAVCGIIRTGKQKHYIENRRITRSEDWIEAWLKRLDSTNTEILGELKRINTKNDDSDDTNNKLHVV